MDLADLTRDEQVALAALLQQVVEADTEASEDELAALQHIADATGASAWTEAMRDADERFPDEAALKAFLPSIQRQEARELIYGAVLEAALPDGMSPHESTLLDWLARAWNITVQVAPPSTDG